MTTAGARFAPERVAPYAASLVVATLLLLAVGRQPAGVFWDDGVYLITARALASGDGYAFTHLPGAPPAVHFPPGWPAILAALCAVLPDFPRNLEALRLVNPVLGAVTAGVACAYGIRRLALPPVPTALVTIIFSATLPVMVLGSVLFAEPAFLLLALCALVVTERAGERGGAALASLAGALAGAAILVRSTGLVLLPAIPAALLFARRRREAFIATAVALALVLPWQLWSSARAAQLAEPLRGNYGPYLPWLLNAVDEQGAGFLGGIVRQNFNALQRSMAVVFFPAGVREVRPLFVTLLALVLGLGLHVTWARARALVAFLVFYALMVLAWPYAPDRFAWGVWPLAGLVLLAGALEAWRFARQREFPAVGRGASYVAVCVAVFALCGLAFYSARGASRGWIDVAQRRNAARLQPIAEWVKAHTPADAVIASDGEPFVHLYSGRRVVPVHVLSPDEYLAGTPLEQAAGDLRALITAGRADYVVLSAGAYELDVASSLTSQVPRLVPVDTLPGGGIAFRVQWKD